MSDVESAISHPANQKSDVQTVISRPARQKPDVCSGRFFQSFSISFNYFSIIGFLTQGPAKDLVDSIMLQLC